MVASNMNGHMQKQLTRSLEKILEEAHLSGELKLGGRKLKDFPKVGCKSQANALKYDLHDTVVADLSKNRFTELPEEITEFPFLEKLHLYHNAIRVIPETVTLLQSLSYLDLSRNQLTSLPREVCILPLQTLLVAHNRLVSLPEELGRMSVLAELDAGCNEIIKLPSRMGDLSRLRCLDLRSNLLVQLPIELTYLKLVKLDISANRISVLPNELRKMKSLVELRLTDNPLTSPPAALCIRGRTHVFKYLERQAAKHEQTRGGRVRRGGAAMESRGHATLDIGRSSHRRYNIDSGYSTSDGFDKRWSQEINSVGYDGEVRGGWRKDCSPLSVTLPHEIGINSSCSGTSTPSTISSGENTSIEDELGKTMILQDQLVKRKLERSASENGEDLRKSLQKSLTPTGTQESNLLRTSQQNSLAQPIQMMNLLNINGEDKKSLSHIQTYKEYKEALKQQRANEGSSVYRSKEQTSLEGTDSTSTASLTGEQLFIEDNKRPLQKITPCRVNYQNMLVNGNNSEYNKIGKHNEQIYKKPNSPIKTSSSILSSGGNSGHVPRLVKTPVGNTDSNKSPSRNVTSPGSPRSYNYGTNSFTMRRELERAKEEADLIEQLRSHIETRLKMALPEDLAPALTDGVVLCHLANYVRPRSVASIHVPSPAVPKLTMARCRRNVDNFLEACRKIGIDENLICCASDVLEGGRGIVRVAVTVTELLRFYQIRSPLHTSSSPIGNNQVST